MDLHQMDFDIDRYLYIFFVALERHMATLILLYYVTDPAFDDYHDYSQTER